MGGVALACVALDTVPRPVRAMIALGPEVFFAMMAGMSVLFLSIPTLAYHAF